MERKTSKQQEAYEGENERMRENMEENNTFYLNKLHRLYF